MTINPNACALSLTDCRTFENVRQGVRSVGCSAATVTVPVSEHISVVCNYYATLALTGPNRGKLEFSVAVPSRKLAGAVALSNNLREAIQEAAQAAIDGWETLTTAEDKAEAALTAPKVSTAASKKTGSKVSRTRVVQTAKLVAMTGEVVAETPVEPTEPMGDTTADPAPLTGAGVTPMTKAKSASK